VQDGDHREGRDIGRDNWRQQKGRENAESEQATDE
jgi:hypothetical protein